MIANLIVLAILGAGPEVVEPADLTRRAELIGREVIVDDRVRYFLESKRGQGHDLFLFKRTDVLFRLPPKLKFGRPPTEPNARVKGVLKLEDGHHVVDVSAIEMLPGDLERLDREIARLRAEDFAIKRSWALWAEKRGKELNEPRLETRGEFLEAEAFWIEASRPDADPLALFARSSGRPIPEADRNALAHRGFRDRLAKARNFAEFDALAVQVREALPHSADPKAASASVEPATVDAYAKEPGLAYRTATEAVRHALDRRLLADAIERSLELQVQANPSEASALAALATEKLADRPDVATRLRRRALKESEGRVASMRQAEMEELARVFREQGEEDRTQGLIRAWLADRRKNRLSSTDAEGRILLAVNYDKLLGDRQTAGDLLREALTIDPDSKSAVDAFLRLDFRKNENGWYDPKLAKSVPSRPANEAPMADPADGGESLKGLTRGQVRSRLGGKPDQIVRSASQGRSVELWIYKNGKGTQVVRFVFEPTTIEPRASAYYSLQK